MALKNPYKRIIRPFKDGKYKFPEYVYHPEYAKIPTHYIRSYLIIQKDLIHLFEYIEPADCNLSTYSIRINELLVRACIEFEANCVAILSENGYSKKGNWNISDFKKVNASHLLSDYLIKLPVWTGNKNIIKPFEDWNSGDSLSWYQAYNKTKHQRYTNFDKAKFEHVINAVCALNIIISAQFYNIEFTDFDHVVLMGGNYDEFNTSTGSYFRIGYPENWPEEDRYDFDWNAIEMQTNNIKNYDYN